MRLQNFSLAGYTNAPPPQKLLDDFRAFFTDAVPNGTSLPWAGGTATKQSNERMQYTLPNGTGQQITPGDDLFMLARNYPGIRQQWINEYGWDGAAEDAAPVVGPGPAPAPTSSNSTQDYYTSIEYYRTLQPAPNATHEGKDGRLIYPDGPGRWVFDPNQITYNIHDRGLKHGWFWELDSTASTAPAPIPATAPAVAPAPAPSVPSYTPPSGIPPQFQQPQNGRNDFVYSDDGGSVAPGQTVPAKNESPSAESKTGLLIVAAIAAAVLLGSNGGRRER